jgi:predicted AlkP superfamily pyrophosphatase or phosphodiesterase
MIRERLLRVFVLIDALGWSLLKGRDFLDDLLPYRRPLRTVLGFSSGAIPTILTGRPPAETGHWNLFYYDPVSSPFRWLRYFNFVPGTLLNHRLTRKLLKEMGRHVFGLGPMFECCVSPSLLRWFNWVEKRNIYEPGGISGIASIFDCLSENGIEHRAYSYHHMNDEEILRRARLDLKSTGAEFYFLYLSEMDQLLHDHCNDSRLLTERLGRYAAGLKELFELALEIDGQASLAVFSDHGMTPVRQQFDLVKAIQELGFVMPDDYLAVYDSTMGRFWFFDERARREIVARLRSVPCGRIVADDELRQLGVLFEDRRYGEVIFLLHPGWLMSRSDFNGRGWKPIGMHGYHPEDPYSDAVFLSNRKPENDVHTIADVYGHMEEDRLVNR